MSDELDLNGEAQHRLRSGSPVQVHCLRVHAVRPERNLKGEGPVPKGIGPLSCLVLAR